MEDLTNLIPVLWFGPQGYGPDELALQLHPIAAEFDSETPASLVVRVRGGEIMFGVGAMVDGGFNLSRESAADLHRQLGAWLEATNE